jgi:hypothetical protein
MFCIGIGVWRRRHDNDTIPPSYLSPSHECSCTVAEVVAPGIEHEVATIGLAPRAVYRARRSQRIADIWSPISRDYVKIVNIQIKHDNARTPTVQCNTVVGVPGPPRANLLWVTARLFVPPPTHYAAGVLYVRGIGWQHKPSGVRIGQGGVTHRETRYVGYIKRSSPGVSNPALI